MKQHLKVGEKSDYINFLKDPFPRVVVPLIFKLGNEELRAMLCIHQACLTHFLGKMQRAKQHFKTPNTELRDGRPAMPLAAPGAFGSSREWSRVTGLTSPSRLLSELYPDLYITSLNSLYNKLLLEFSIKEKYNLEELR